MYIGQYQKKTLSLQHQLRVSPIGLFGHCVTQWDADMTVSEMLSSNPQVWKTDKSRLRMIHSDELGISAVQIAGSDPDEMAAAARINVANGAQIIDINMGWPAKKVNRKLAGSALLRYPELIKKILLAVVNAVDVPFTLKVRTG
ncbi:tRNA-dihydrouridine synthase A [Arsenophonus endosymbiont of Bemisia tabaci Q2]|nr:tRNA-dihydrouridine synthase A [Arsenophonus endosymbiont of Bemisia tabaci Q2]